MEKSKGHIPFKSLIQAVAIVAIAVIGWEFYLRHQGLEPDFDDGPELWANSRSMVYGPADKTTVFIGSSRIKYDLDVPAWEKQTKSHVVQLAMVGSSPRTMLTDLANDTNFKGKLIVDVTETLFFNPAPRVFLSPNEGIGYYRKRTPAQKVSFMFDRIIEGNMVMFNQPFYSVNGLLNHLYLPNRLGVYTMPDCPVGFGQTQYSRQTKMTKAFLADTSRINKVKAIWAGMVKLNTGAPISGKGLEAVMTSVKRDADKIKARGGDVVFTRTPSSGPLFKGESRGFPRAMYWDRLLAVTGCKGIYFTDYPQTAKLTCPEFSHLQPKDALVYTAGLVTALKQKTNWKL